CSGRRRRGSATEGGPAGAPREVADSPTRSRIASPSPPATMRGRLRLRGARIEPGVIGAVRDPAVRCGGGTLLVLQDRLLDGGANEGGAPSRSGRSHLFEHFEGVFVDLDQYLLHILSYKGKPRRP